MFYGFDAKTKKALWSADGAVVGEDGIVIIESCDDHDLRKIELGVSDEGEPAIVPRTLSKAERTITVTAQRDAMMAYAATQIDLYRDVVEFTPSDEAEAKLTAWRKYRVELFNLDVSDPENVQWPVAPSK